MRRASKSAVVAVEELPAALRAVVAEALTSQMYGNAMEAIEDWLHERGERPGPVLVALAWLVFEDALTVMVDEVAPRGERALALLEESKARGPAIASLRRRIRSAIAREKDREARVLALLSTPLEELDSTEAKDLAYALSDRKDKASKSRAAELWRMLTQRVESGAPSATPASYYRARWALDLANSGRWDEATPMLEAIVAEGTRTYEGWMVDFAFYSLLQCAVEGGARTQLRALWERAVASARSRGEEFPIARPVQERLLEAALSLDLPDIARQLVAVIQKLRSPRQISAELKQRMERASPS